MTRDRFLILFLRLVGTVAGLAVFCVAMPYAWMDATHRFLGMGALPDAPIVGYLARSTSAFYAMLGGLFWVMSCDLSRYRPLLRYVGLAIMLLGVALTVIDHLEGLPLFWQAGEGPFDAAIGAVILFLARSVKEKHP